MRAHLRSTRGRVAPRARAIATRRSTRDRLCMGEAAESVPHLGNGRVRAHDERRKKSATVSSSGPGGYVCPHRDKLSTNPNRRAADRRRSRGPLADQSALMPSTRRQSLISGRHRCWPPTHTDSLSARRALGFLSLLVRLSRLPMPYGKLASDRPTTSQDGAARRHRRLAVPMLRFPLRTQSTRSGAVSTRADAKSNSAVANRFLYYEFCHNGMVDGLLPQQYASGWGQALRFDSNTTTYRTEWKAIAVNSNWKNILLYDATH